jgi:hypothetical protein
MAYKNCFLRWMKQLGSSFALSISMDEMLAEENQREV